MLLGEQVRNGWCCFNLMNKGRHNQVEAASARKTLLVLRLAAATGPSRVRLRP
jgi:hypothetical protein